jgi:type I restriction enzyme M protein
MYALTYANLNQYAKVGGQPSISQSTIYEVKIPLPSIEEQKAIVQAIEEEMQLVNANKRLIEIFEQKIKDKISEVWGVKEEVETV